jgi:CubicO group peptidase (beta-lactamase class C family)
MRQVNGSAPGRLSRRCFLKLAAASGLLAGCRSARSLPPTLTREPTSTPAATLTPAPTATATPLPAYWPTEGWRASTPEQQGMDSELLVRMFEFIEEQALNFHSVSIVRNGYVVTDACIHPFGQDSKHIMHSAAKSIVSALIGIAIDRGDIEGVSQSILDFFPGRAMAHVDADKQAMTLEHALTMSTGLRCEDSAASDWHTFRQMTQSQDWVQFMLDLPMAEQPGTHFEYCNGVSLLLSAVLQEATGTSALAFAEEHLFGPLGISDVGWLSTPQGVATGYGRLWMRPHDMAKIGYLYLNNGRWDGEQIVSSAWVKTSTRKHISPSPGGGYGYQWWVRDADSYVADGYAGQRIIVIPERELVVVLTGGLRDERAVGMLLYNFVIPAADSPLPRPENPKGVALLESRIQALANPQPEPVPSLPDMAQSISGRRYVLGSDAFGWQSFSLQSREQEASITLFLGEDSLELPIGLDDVHRMTYVDQPALITLLDDTTREPDIDRMIQANQSGFVNSPVALKGSWRDDNTFVVCEQTVGWHDRLELSLAFDEGGVDIRERAYKRGTSRTVRGTLAG